MRKLTLGILASSILLFTSSFRPKDGEEEWKDIFKKIKAEVEKKQNTFFNYSIIIFVKVNKLGLPQATPSRECTPL